MYPNGQPPQHRQDKGAAVEKTEEQIREGKSHENMTESECARLHKSGLQWDQGTLGLPREHPWPVHSYFMKTSIRYCFFVSWLSASWWSYVSRSLANKKTSIFWLFSWPLPLAAATLPKPNLTPEAPWAQDPPTDLW